MDSEITKRGKCLIFIFNLSSQTRGWCLLMVNSLLAIKSWKTAFFSWGKLMDIYYFAPCADSFLQFHNEKWDFLWAREILSYSRAISQILQTSFHTSVHPSNEKFLQSCSFLQFGINPYAADNSPTHSINHTQWDDWFLHFNNLQNHRSKKISPL